MRTRFIVGFLIVFIALSASIAHAATYGCTTGPAIGAFEILIKATPTSTPRPLRSVNVITEGYKIVYKPLEMSNDDRKKAKVSIVLLPPESLDGKAEVKVLTPKPAGKPAEWDVPIRVGTLAVVYGPQGLEAKKVTTLVDKDRELLRQLAAYAEKTQATEALIAALLQESNEANSNPNMDAAMRTFATQYGISPGKLDRTQAADQQALTLIRTLNPAVAAYDPLAAKPATRVQQSTSVATSIAGLFLGSGFGLAASGAAVFVNMRTMLFPNTEFRSALVQPGKDDGLALCGRRDAKSRTRTAFLWAMRVPNTAPPKLDWFAPVHLPAGVKSKAVVKDVPGADWKNVDRAYGWKLEPAAGFGPSAPVGVHVAGDNTLELDLSKVTLPAGQYRLAGLWDWTPIQVTGDLSVHPMPDLSAAKLTPASQDKLVAGAGPVTVELAGADFQFVEKAEIRPALNRKAPPQPVNIEFPRGRRAGTQTRMTAELGSLENSVYVLTLVQPDGKPQEVPVRVLPSNPKVTNLPVRLNLGEGEQTLSLQGSGLERVIALSSNGLKLNLLPGGGNERKATVRLSSGIRAGQKFDLSMTVADHQTPIVLKDAILVAAPRPAIVQVQPSRPAALSVALANDEIPAGYTVSFAMRLAAPVDQPRVSVACTQPRQTLRPVNLRPGEESGTARLGSPGAGMLFLSFDPGEVAQAGCRLQVTVETDAEGRSEARPLGRVVRLPKIEALSMSGEKVGEGTYGAVLKGQDLETVEKAGWNATEGVAVRGLPSPVAGDARKQVLEIALPWPSPAPQSPIYIWLRGETKGRETTVRY